MTVRKITGFRTLTFRTDRSWPGWFDSPENPRVFVDMKATPPEADVIQAVQKHLPDTLEAQILVSSPQRSVWYASGSRSGGYEIRRKDPFVQPRCLAGNKIGMPSLCTWFILSFMLCRHFPPLRGM